MDDKPKKSTRTALEITGKTESAIAAIERLSGSLKSLHGMIGDINKVSETFGGNMEKAAGATQIALTNLAKTSHAVAGGIEADEGRKTRAYKKGAEAQKEAARIIQSGTPPLRERKDTSLVTGRSKVSNTYATPDGGKVTFQTNTKGELVRQINDVNRAKLAAEAIDQRLADQITAEKDRTAELLKSAKSVAEVYRIQANELKNTAAILGKVIEAESKLGTFGDKQLMSKRRALVKLQETLSGKGDVLGIKLDSASQSDELRTAKLDAVRLSKRRFTAVLESGGSKALARNAAANMMANQMSAYAAFAAAVSDIKSKFPKLAKLAKFEFLPEPDFKKEHGGSGITGVFSQGKKIVLSSALGADKAAYLEMLAHELGHAVDLKKLGVEKFNALRPDPKISPKDKGFFEQPSERTAARLQLAMLGKIKAGEFSGSISAESEAQNAVYRAQEALSRADLNAHYEREQASLTKASEAFEKKRANQLRRAYGNRLVRNYEIGVAEIKGKGAQAELDVFGDPKKVAIAKLKTARELAAFEQQSFNLAMAGPGRRAGKLADTGGGDFAAKRSVGIIETTTAITKQEIAWGKAMAKMGDYERYLGRNLIQNLKHVTAWTTSVGILYGSINLLKASLTSMTEIQYQEARLQQVLNAGYEDNRMATRKLTDEVLRWAAVNGRSSKEAMESAVQWSRLGWNRVDVAEAVRVSLVAANVAELTAGDATERLSALVVTYNLKAKDLSATLGLLNSVSNTYNVSNADLLDGLSKTSGVAKQAGVGLAELIGLIGAGKGATGQTGANIGNAIKSIIGRTVQPDVQKKLRDTFDFEATSEGGEKLKSFSEILREMYVHWQKLSQVERGSMLFQVAGRNQVSRLQGILDNYVRSQILAIQALQNTNSAEKENALITDTMRANLAGLSTEWDRFVSNIGSNGANKALGEVAKSFRNLLDGFNKMPLASSVILATFAAISAKAILTGVAIEKGLMDVPLKNGGYLRHTFKALFTTGGEIANMMGTMSRGGGPVTGMSNALLGSKYLPMSDQWKSRVMNDTTDTRGRWVRQGKQLRFDSSPVAVASSEVKQGMIEFAKFGKTLDTDQLKIYRAKYRELVAEFRGRGMPFAEASKGARAMAQAFMVQGYAAGALTKTLRVLAVSFLDVMVPMAALLALMWAVNKAWDAFTGGFDAFDKSIAATGQQIKILDSAAEAAGLQIRLIKTVMEGMDKATGGRALGLSQSLAMAISPVNVTGTDKERNAAEKAQAALKTQIDLLTKAGDLEGVRKITAQAILKLELEKNEAMTKRLQMQAQEVNTIGDQQRKAKGALIRDPKKEAELESQMQEARGRVSQTTIAALDDNEASLEAFMQTSKEFKIFKATIDSVGSSVKAMMDSLGDATPLQQLGRQVIADTVELDFLNEKLASVEDQLKAEGVSDPTTKLILEKDAKSQKAVDLQAEADRFKADKLQLRRNALESPGGGNGQVISPTDTGVTITMTGEDQKKYNELVGEANQLNKEAADIGAELTRRTGGKIEALDAESKALKENKTALEVKLAAEQNAAAVQAAIMQERMAIAGELGKSKMDAMLIGETPAEQLAARKDSLEKAYKEEQKTRNNLLALDTGDPQRRSEQKFREGLVNRPGFKLGNIGSEDLIEFGKGPFRDSFNREKALKPKGNLTEVGTQNLANSQRAAELYSMQLVADRIEAKKTLNQLERDETNLIIQKNREYQKGLLTAGPGELLRKLAVAQLSSGGKTSAGQFFAMSSEARGDFLSMGQNSPEFKRMERDKATLNKAYPGLTLDGIQNFSTGETGKRTQMEAEFGKTVIPKILQSVADAVDHSFQNVSKAANGAATALASISTLIKGLGVPQTVQTPAGPAQGKFKRNFSVPSF